PSPVAPQDALCKALVLFRQTMEDVLNLHDTAQLRRRELLHKHWTERLWLPLQKHLNQRVSSYGAIDIKRRQGLYSQYLQHYNSKGYVFLDTYNPKEYDPFLCHLKRSHYVKVTFLKFWSYLRCSGMYSRQEDKLPHYFQSSLVSNSPVTPGTPLGTPSSYSPSTSTKTPEKKAVRKALSRYPLYRLSDCVRDL
uniref:Uncharacterized protein n=1 Tax=Periophthalmus magnuspinnatus TaxID=409849 RepID=A0A3B3Z8A2_9GOBI